MTDYRKRVDEAISSGRLWRAKEILQGRLADAGYDAELFLKYGIVLKQMGDLRIAGRYLFLSGNRDADFDECINIFRDLDCNGPFSKFWNSMPKAVQNLPKHIVPDSILEELTDLGFNKSEIDAVFAGIENKIATTKARNDGSASIKADWVGYCFIAFFLLLLLGLLYQAIVGVIAVGRFAISWIGV